ncbi:hypothetical protein GCM10009555_064700 [Acrocarpospora macrocephala]|uniref:histidine kinase n=1 Tax=Acrocarpospora macrocephala TaxID=150177 RepID=A0A5M3X9S4_9ACTN|nr:histidine kinase [Acrocarpospora macrocephala]GES16939.1 hypothetical protein Amac_105370 [Acrocarpospora macrocephala]
MGKDTVADLGLALAGGVVAVAVSSGGWWSDPVRFAAVLATAIAAGASAGAIRRSGAGVIALIGIMLGLLLVINDRFVPDARNGPQLLLPVALAALAYRGSWRLLVPAAALGCTATALNLAGPEFAMTPASVVIAFLVTGLALVAGRYLRADLSRPERALLLDLLLAGGGMTFMLLDTWPYWHDEPWPSWTWLVVCCGATAGLVRRRARLALGLQAVLLVLVKALVPAAADSLQLMLLATLGVFAMGASWAWTAVTCAFVTGVTALNIVDDDWPEVTPSRVAALLVTVAAPIAIGRYIGIRRSAIRLRTAMAEEARQLAEARLRADQFAERERIARDVHDIVAHHVGAMVLRASAARYAGASQPVTEALSDIRSTGHQVLEDLRGLLNVLRVPETLGQLPVSDPGEMVIDAVERMRAAGLSVELRMEPEVERVPLVTRASAARIVQEGLTNVLKHAGPGTSARVGLSVSGGPLLVEVLSGPPPEPGVGRALPSSGQGVTGMRERARALGGDLSSGPDSEGGWRLVATLPLEVHHEGRER